MEPATLGPVALPEVVRHVVKEQKLAALARIITVDMNLKPAVIVGDTEQIRTVVDNLMSNAIKYSPRAGQIEITLGSQSGYAVLDVVDQGSGIAPADRERVFESFYTGKPPADGKVKGSGLGLAIAREYALAHGGRIEVLDRADGQRGACFRLFLPLAPGTGGSLAKAAPATRWRSGAHAIRRSAWVARCWRPGCRVRYSDAAAGGLTPQEEFEPEVVPAPTMLVEYPPIESVEPPPQRAAGGCADGAPGTNAVALGASLSPGAPGVPKAPEPNTDDQQLICAAG